MANIFNFSINNMIRGADWLIADVRPSGKKRNIKKSLRYV